MKTSDCTLTIHDYWCTCMILSTSGFRDCFIWWYAYLAIDFCTSLASDHLDLENLTGVESPPVNYKHTRAGYHHIEMVIIIWDLAYHYWIRILETVIHHIKNGNHHVRSGYHYWIWNMRYGLSSLNLHVGKWYMNYKWKFKLPDITRSIMMITLFNMQI